MARQSASANASKSKKPSSAKGRASAPAGRKAPLRGKAAAAEEARLLDERTRHDIVGVVFAVLAAVLLVAAVLPTDAIVTSFLSTALHLTLGLGAYLLPFLLLAIGGELPCALRPRAGSRPRGGGAGLGLLCRAGPAGALHAPRPTRTTFRRSSTTSSWPHVAATWARAWPGWGSLCSARWFRASSCRCHPGGARRRRVLALQAHRARAREARGTRRGGRALTRRPSPACAEARTWPPKAGTLPW